MFSLWEKQSYLKHDLIIIGGGIVGLSVGCSVLERYPEKKVLILERGVIPTGASTKNAGFICSGSFTEFMQDIEKMGEKKTVDLFYSRQLGLSRLIKRLGIEGCDAKFQGAYELIYDEKSCNPSLLKYANDLLKKIYKKDVFIQRDELIEQFDLNKQKIKMIVENVLEGQIDTGLTMRNLYKHFVSKGGLYLTGSEVKQYDQFKSNHIRVSVKNTANPKQDIVFEGTDLVICTNGFAQELSKQILDVLPGRGQVIVTKPIENLKIKGTFHMDEGYYYFRDFYGRVIFGGGRNTDFEKETTTEIASNPNIVNNLIHLLKTVILPQAPFEIDYEWSGIMCFSKTGKDKTPITQKESENIYYAVRMNGMGVALSSNIGEQMANELYGNQQQKEEEQPNQISPSL